MSTNTIEPTLDFIPAGHSRQRPHGLVRAIRDFFAAINEGLEAAYQYERLTARGMPPAKAVRIVFRDHFAEHR